MPAWRAAVTFPCWTMSRSHDRAQFPLAPRRAHRSRWSALALAAVCACQGGTASERAPAAATPSPSASATPEDTSNEPRWRYLPAFRAVAEPLGEGGVGAAPVLEVANGRTGHARFLVAVVRPGEDPELRVELWAFSQNNARGLLEPAGEPIAAVVRLRSSDPRAPELERLREEIATPGVEKTRPRGLESETPTAFVEALTRAAKAASAPGEASARAEALARVIRGVDDTILLERDAVFRVFELAEVDRDWVEIEPSSPTSRRRRLDAAAPNDPLSLELLQTRDGWILSAIRERAPAADASAEPDATPG